MSQDRYRADRFDADGKFFVFDTHDGGAECAGPFATIEDAIVEQDRLNRLQEYGLPDTATNRTAIREREESPAFIANSGRDEDKDIDLNEDPDYEGNAEHERNLEGRAVKGPPITCWTITLGEGDENEEALSVYTVNSYEADMFMDRLVNQGDGCSAYGEYLQEIPRVLSNRGGAATTTDPQRAAAQDDPRGEADR